MRILIIHTSYKVRGGEDSVVDNERDLLISAGHEVNLLSFSNSGATFSKLLRLPFNYSSYLSAKIKIIAFRPDIIHIHNLHFAGSTAVLYAVKKSKVPMVVTLHNYRLLCPGGTLFHKGRLFMDSIDKLFPWKAIKEGIYQDSVPITFWVACCTAAHQLLRTWALPDRIIMLGKNQEEIFLNSKYRSLANKMVIKPNFSYILINEKKDAGEYYLYVGRLSPEKGIDMLLNTFSRLNIMLKIAGLGMMEEKVKEYAATYSNIEFLGAKDKIEISELMAGAKALIFPSIWHEPFGLVIIEAFACGLPVIAAAIGEPKYMVTNQKNGLLFKPGDDNDLANKVNYFEGLSSGQKAVYSDAARETYNRFYSPEKNINMLENIYSSVLAQ